MNKLNTLCHRGNKNIENGTDSGQFGPVSGSPDQLELAQVSDIPLPLYKRLWVDPLNFRWITTFIWAVGVGVTFGIMGDFSMFYMFLEREFDSSVTELSWLGALPWCLCCFFSPLSTLIVHRFGYRATMVGACFVCAIGLFSTSFIQELWPAFLSYSLFFGGSSVVLYTVGCVYVTGYFDKKHCTGPVSTNGLAFEIAILVFSPVIQVTSDEWGWRWSVRLLSCCTLGAAFLFIVFIREPPSDMFNDDDDDVVDDKKKHYQQLREKEKKESGVENGGVVEERQDGEEEEEQGKEEVEQEEEKHWKASLKRYITLFKMPAFSILLIGIVISFTALSFNHINFGSYLTSVGISDQKTALLHSLLAGSALVGRVSVLFVHLLPFSILLTYPIIAVISCGVSVVVLLVTPHWIFYIYSILIGLMRGLYFSLATGIAVELSGKEKAAEAYALAFVAWGVGSALAAVVPGITHELTGSYTLSMTLCAAFWGVSAILFFFVYLLNRRARAKRKRLSSNSKVNELKKEPLPLKDIRKDQIVSASYSPLPTEDVTTV
ncbi:monocarboxylate transporter 7 [Strongylocentrotus purpuratus]|uniref:Major facilitator superfamily (MFS) profile domain-containing protein n=1 Tax=Strongylocentrotus purpuratus TaxID=7668 RepID=A0A7M7LIL5_STRPU|nr:monocarboxylate transporter 7 [Strongylocentrotus purpuratus]XP_011683862.2 monocarboxylate transporter 7 [Strongylocentrotus purpuratus]